MLTSFGPWKRARYVLILLLHDRMKHYYVRIYKLHFYRFYLLLYDKIRNENFHIVVVLVSYNDPSYTTQNRPDLRRNISVHILNHVITGRRRILRHDRKIKATEAKMAVETLAQERDAKRRKEKKRNAALSPVKHIAVEELIPQHRDQGFTRPTVLILLPTRSSALALVEALSELSDGPMEHLDRFRAEYSPPLLEKEKGSPSDYDDTVKLKEEQRRRKVLAKKGPEWNEWFGDRANDDDQFKIGIQVTDAAGAGKLKLYTDFYGSDIILASPLGLKVATSKKGNDISSESEEDTEEEDDEKKPKCAPDADFLSSIEICAVLHSHVFLQQNFDHVLSSLGLLNCMPTADHGTDYSRVREYCLDGHASTRRQLVLTTAAIDPTLLSTLRRFGKSHGGIVRVRIATGKKRAAIADVAWSGAAGGGVRQVFQRVDCASPCDAGAVLVRYFCNHVLADVERARKGQMLVYVESYFDYVSLRNVLKRRGERKGVRAGSTSLSSFCTITEYSGPEEQTRARSAFFHGRNDIMLYTGRAHFFHRLAIRGARHVVFVGVPMLSQFYADLVNGMDVWGNGGGGQHHEENYNSNSSTDNDDDVMITPPSVLSLFTKYDALALERVVSNNHCKHMVNSAKSTFMFST
mmetsp:Transcript_18261/g.41655  ORF Transcript_18261/g.41655 Transcript_18261/m.41655 type:complete len:636 (-) Transcript_18261:30-1937(-)